VVNLMKLKGVIFDLDGVVVDTVPLHFKAWKQMFEEYGKTFSFEDYKKKVDGIPRIDGARAILSDLSDRKLRKAAEKKQKYYLGFLNQKGVKVYQDTLELTKKLREKGAKIAVISSSKNCRYVLRKAGVNKFIDVIIDGNEITKGKPDPQIFLIALQRLGLKPNECIVFEDSKLGVSASKSANIFTIGVDRYEDPQRFTGVDLIIKNLSELSGKEKWGWWISGEQN